MPAYNAVHNILTNPIYAGAYAFGRTGSQVSVVEGRKHIRRGVRRPIAEWDVLLKEQHEGYITWDEFELNQRLIADNATGMGRTIARGAVHQGEVLLAGLLRCGHCGRKLQVHYSGKLGRYNCYGARMNHGTARCISLGNRSADAAVVGVDGPRRHRLCQNEVVADLRQRRPSVEQISRIGMDTSKHFFQLHGVNAAEKVVLRKKLRRKEMVAFFKALAPTVIGIEACGASHHWARLLRSFGHEVKLIAPQLVKPYVKRGKNDAADAEALCEAMSRPTMRFVPVKTAEQQAALMLVGVRDRLIRNRTQLSNAIRGYAAEFGFTAAKGMAHLDPLLERIQADESVPALARELFAVQAKEYAQLQAQIDEVDAKLMAWHKADECSRRLAKIPGVGPIGAALLMMKTPAPELFRSGRQFAAWIGLTPKDHSTAGKVRLGVITRAGDEALRSVLVVGATAVIQQRSTRRTRVALARRRFSSANRRSWPPWRWPTRWPASPGS